MHKPIYRVTRLWPKLVLIAIPLICMAAVTALPTNDNESDSTNHNNFRTDQLAKPTGANVVSEEPSNTPEGTNRSTSNVSVDVTQKSSGTGSANIRSQSSDQNQSSSKVTVNGRTIDVPQNGSVHKTLTDNNGTTTVDVKVQNSGSSSSSSVNVNGSSETTVHSE